MSTLTDAIYQNTPGNSKGFPLGVPTSYSWYRGDSGFSDSTPPSNFTALTGWGQIYPEVGQPVVAGSVQIANFQTWVHLKTGSWVKVQDQATDPIVGSHYPANFHGSNVPWHKTTLSDGSISVDAPQSGWNDHFWPGSRGKYAPGTVDGVFVEASMRTTNSNEHYVANLGADWWLSPSAGFNPNFSNNPGAGMSDWVELSTSWKQLYFTSWSTQQLQANPPPPLLGSSTSTTLTTPTSATPQTIAVTDPRPAASTSPQTVAATAPQPITATDHLPAVPPSAGVLANHGFALLQQQMGSGTGTLATTAPRAITLADHLPAAGTATASLASQSFALLNQHLSSNSGQLDSGQIATTVSQAGGSGQQAFLTTPQH